MSARSSRTSCSTSPRRRVDAHALVGRAVARRVRRDLRADPRHLRRRALRARRRVAPFAVGGYIAAAYWFTSSTIFANPAVTIAPHADATRSPASARVSAPMFIVVQIVGALGAVVLGAVPGIPNVPRDDVVVPHEHRSPRDDRRPASVGVVSLRAQRGPVADGARLVQRTSRADARRRGRAARSPPTRSTRPRSRPWPKSASTSPRSSRSRGPTRSCAPPTSSSRWAAATRARSIPASVTRTGSSTTRPGKARAVRPIRDEIRERVAELLKSLAVDVSVVGQFDSD